MTDKELLEKFYERFRLQCIVKHFKIEQDPIPIDSDGLYNINYLYKIICIAKDTETEELKVVYQALYQNDKGEYPYFIRPLWMFISEVDHEKYPDIKQKYRFERI